MNILIVTWYFPPYNSMGSLRCGNFAKYLLSQGHDVKILSARDQPYPKTLPIDFTDERVIRTRHIYVNDFPNRVHGWISALKSIVSGGPKKTRASDTTTEANAGEPPSASRAVGPRRLGNWLLAKYRLITNFPDARVGWYPYAVAEGRKLLMGWRPDLIFASGPPFTALFIGARLARQFGVPWVAEFRDRWSEDPYRDDPPWRLWLEDKAEDRLLRDVQGLVTVSEPWAEAYRRRLSIPIQSIMNGFNPEDYPEDFERVDPDPDRVRVVYTGILYPDRRDPSPLFAALKLLGDKSAHVRVAFFGADPETLAALARSHDVEHLVEINDRVPYRDSLRLQMEADVLLLLQWNNPLEQGNVPGKLFEYIGARRPVLGLGLEDGVPARILAERGAGSVINDPQAIARRLEEWIDQKRKHGSIPANPPESRDGCSRIEQHRILEAFLIRIIDRPDPEGAPDELSTTSRVESLDA